MRRQTHLRRSRPRLPLEARSPGTCREALRVRRVNRSLRLEGDATCQEVMRAVERMIYAETDPFEEELAAPAFGSAIPEDLP